MILFLGGSWSKERLDQEEEIVNGCLLYLGEEDPFNLKNLSLANCLWKHFNS